MTKNEKKIVSDILTYVADKLGISINEIKQELNLQMDRISPNSAETAVYRGNTNPDGIIRGKEVVQSTRRNDGIARTVVEKSNYRITNTKSVKA